MSFHAPQEHLCAHPFLGLGHGNNGFFKFKKNNITYYCQASDGLGSGDLSNYGCGYEGSGSGAGDGYCRDY